VWLSGNNITKVFFVSFQEDLPVFKVGLGFGLDARF
jgi:hypothetical protein